MVNKKYFKIIKPKIIVGNLIAILGGVFLSNKWNIKILFCSLLGLGLIIASSCVINNYIDLDIDSIMLRTNNRVLIKEFIFIKKAISYAYILFLIGIIILFKLTNILVISLSLLGIVIYLLMYSLYFKRNSAYSTLIGSLAGSLPPIMGYCTISNKIDLAAFIMFLIYYLWQIPHSYSLAILKKKEYMLASIPVFPISKGMLTTLKHIIIYIFLFTIAELMLFFNGFTGYIYLSLMTILSTYWLSVAIFNYKRNTIRSKKQLKKNEKVMIQTIFVMSVLIIMFLNLLLSIDVNKK